MAISPVVAMWAESETLMGMAAHGRLVVTARDGICRDDLVPNEDVITPVLKHCGLRTTIHQIWEHVELFFGYARPKGKKAIPRTFHAFDIHFVWLMSLDLD